MAQTASIVVLHLVLGIVVFLLRGIRLQLDGFGSKLDARLKALDADTAKAFDSALAKRLKE